MNDVLFVGKRNGLGNLPHDPQTQFVGDVLLPQDQVVVQADGVGEVLEDDSRAEFVVGELHRPEYSAVFQGLKETEFPLGRSLNRQPLLLIGLGTNQVDPDAADCV